MTKANAKLSSVSKRAEGQKKKKKVNRSWATNGSQVMSDEDNRAEARWMLTSIGRRRERSAPYVRPVLSNCVTSKKPVVVAGWETDKVEVRLRHLVKKKIFAIVWLCTWLMPNLIRRFPRLPPGRLHGAASLCASVPCEANQSGRVRVRAVRQGTRSFPPAHLHVKSPFHPSTLPNCC